MARDLTSIGPAQDALRTVIAERIADVQVTLGYPPGGPTSTHVWISGDIEEWTQEWQITGNNEQKRDEQYVIPVSIVAIQTGKEFKPVRDRVLELAREVGIGILSDVTLGGVVFDARPAGGQAYEFLQASKRGYGLELRIQIEAHVA